ncbi:MAG: hypothetical protein DRN68_07075, partial [Thaumarchaeota archaeon]
MRKCFLLLFFVFGIFSIIPSANALYDSFQNHPNDNLSLCNNNDITCVRWKVTEGYSFYDYWTTEIKTYPYDDTKVVFMGGKVTTYNWWWEEMQTLEPEYSTYWSFTLVECKPFRGRFKFKFFDENMALINESEWIFLSDYPYENSKWELIKSGNTIALYINGTYMRDIGGIYNEDIYYFAIRFYEYGGSGSTALYIDDFTTSGDIIGTIPHTWLIKRNWDNPDASGVWDGVTKVSTHIFHTSYAGRRVISYYNINPPPDKIVTKHYTTGEIVNITIVNKSAGIVTYNLTEMLFHDDPSEDKYGLYIQELERGGSVIARDYFYFDFESASVTVSGTITWDKDCYASGEVAKIHTNLTNPDFSTYVYKGYVYDVCGNKKEEWTVTSANEWHEVDLNGYDAGVYYAILKIRNKNTGFEWEEAWDVTSVSEEVRIEGVSYDAKSETVLGGVYVNAIQNYEDHETTTNATTGEYNISGLTVDMEIQMNASKANYTHNNFSFTPLQNGLYEVNLFLLPDASRINVTTPAIVGLTQLYPFHQNVSYATVNIWNDTWNASTTTNSMGYFAFENLTPGIYYLNATHEGYKSSETYGVNLTSGEIEYVYILMYGLYNLTVRARDAGTHATIFNFKATLNDGEQTKETSSGWLNFTGVEYGIHKVEVGADGYYSAIEYVYVYGDVEKIVYLMPLEGEVEQGVGISYPPHQVEFACVDVFGNPLANVYVQATPISTTTGAWDWLLKLFGIRNESISYYTNQTLNGTTDSRGAITFVMMENVEYEVRFVNESLGINKTIRIYPKADHYTVILTPVTSSIVSSEDYITFNLSYEIIDDEINLSLVYNDSLNQTQNLTFFVYNSTALLYSQNFTNTSNITVSYTVPYEAGEEYTWGYSAFHSKFGEMGRSRILRIAWFLDLGISRAYCTWIAIAIILFLTAMFSFTTVKFGYVAIPIVSLIFAFIGWLPNISI